MVCRDNGSAQDFTSGHSVIAEHRCDLRIPARMVFIPKRTAGLAQLEHFLPRTGEDYARTRNHDEGTGRQNVSQLSPWLHAGLISEEEVLARVLDTHRRDDADKFIGEVFWRIYFKGYLEQRPAIWRNFCEQRGNALAHLGGNAGMAKAYAEAVEGRTGIAAFDHWARELVDTGYLHNHARMWFASIWIFTLKLDWTLGADFFLRHLMDADAASNTLSWRWVGGLHTKGKTYLARGSNIARYTANHPAGPLEAKGLASDAEPLVEANEPGRQDLDLPAEAPGFAADEPYALLLHDEGASHVPLKLANPPALIIAAARPAARSPSETGSAAREFARGAVSNGLADAAETYDCPSREWAHEGQLQALLGAAGIARVVTAYLPTGWTRDALWPELRPLEDAGQLTQLLPDLQRHAWPHARAGFFRVKKEIDAALRTAGLNAG